MAVWFSTRSLLTNPRKDFGFDSVLFWLLFIVVVVILYNNIGYVYSVDQLYLYT